MQLNPVHKSSIRFAAERERRQAETRLQMAQAVASGRGVRIRHGRQPWTVQYFSTWDRAEEFVQRALEGGYKVEWLPLPVRSVEQEVA